MNALVLITGLTAIICFLALWFIDSESRPRTAKAVCATGFAACFLFVVSVLVTSYVNAVK